MSAWLKDAGLSPDADTVTRLRASTHGNPRLLELCLALHHAGESLTETLTRFEQEGAPSVEFLLNRIWPRLSDDEQAALASLCVFRRPAPAEAWAGEVRAQLSPRRLIQLDERGGLALLPAYRAVLHHLLPPENRHAAHLRAAEVRAAHAEYTAAAYHYLEAGQPRRALWLWHEHRAEEINQGQASAALRLFSALAPKSLKPIERNLLTLILGELQKLLGDDPRVTLRQTLWRAPILQAQAKRLEGDLAELKGDYDEAIEAYQAGLVLVENLLGERALFLKNLGWTQMRQGGDGLGRAWQTACLARFEAERLQGDIQRRRGQFAEAEAHYRQALALAESFGHLEGQAKAHNHLAILLSQQSRFDDAHPHRAHAIALFEQIGNRVHLAGAKLNQALDHNLAGQGQAAYPPAAAHLFPIFQQAVRSAEEALRLFEQVGQAFGRATAAQNLAEAHLYLGQLAEAEKFARLVLREEEQSVQPDGLRTLGEIKTAQRDFNLAETLIRQSIQAAQDNGDPYLEAYGWRALGHLYLVQGQREPGRAALRQAVALFEAQGLRHEVERTQALEARFQS